MNKRTAPIKSMMREEDAGVVVYVGTLDESEKRRVLVIERWAAELARPQLIELAKAVVTKLMTDAGLPAPIEWKELKPTDPN